MKDKQFIIKPEDVVKIIDDSRGCIVSDRISVDGEKVGYMYREELDEDIEKDSGWRFLAGTEDEEYVEDFDNSEIVTLNMVANFDKAILPYLKMKIGAELERIEGTDQFITVED